MNTLLYLLAWLVHVAYCYCRDLMVSLGSLAYVSYSDANTWVRLLLVPGLLIGVRVGQWFRLRR